MTFDQKQRFGIGMGVKAFPPFLLDRGCTAPEIMAISGHASLSEVQKYISAVKQDKLAEAAMVKRAAGSNRAQMSD
jgi:hypothetical protein